MPTAREASPMIAGIIGAGEILIIIVVVLIMAGHRQISQGCIRGFFEFWRGIKGLRDDLDREAEEAGRSFAGIHGAPTAQALTPDNQVAELYRPAVFQPKRQRNHFLFRLGRVAKRFWKFALKLVRSKS